MNLSLGPRGFSQEISADADVGKRRVVIEGVVPEIDDGRFPIKRIVGDTVQLEADIFADGHDELSAVLLYRHSAEDEWTEVPMQMLVNDRWRGGFPVLCLGTYLYTFMAWVNEFITWRRDLEKKVAAGLDVAVELLMGAELLMQSCRRAGGEEAAFLDGWATILRDESLSQSTRVDLAMADRLGLLASKWQDRRSAASYPKDLRVTVDRDKARYGTWYELFPRSCSQEPGWHGTLKDCENHLEYVASMGFDVLYLPPIHPIGSTNRKGRNNAPVARSDDPGSPWAIGGEAGGHKSIEPRLGDLDDFRSLLATAHGHGMEIAMDLSIQCSPDHPWVKEHPEWFRWRPDGTIQFAENPPKKYQDIYPVDFGTDRWPELWEELRSVVLFWIEQGVRMFRVDNPHTKPFGFWEWLIGDIKGRFPEVIFLSEAFTRPKIMYRLAKLGFTQSYTYFAWRNTKWELTEYFRELNETAVHEYFRPNLWPNTPDILTGYMQVGGRPAFMIRLVLAATLSPSYGIYGPAFELCENVAKEPGSEEYLNSEKYEIKNWDLESAHSLKDFITQVNQVRKDNKALQMDGNVRFHPIDNELLLCYSKQSRDRSNVILVIANLDYVYVQSGWVNLPLEFLGIDPLEPYELCDLMDGSCYIWHGPRNYVELNPHVAPAHIFRLPANPRG